MENQTLARITGGRKFFITHNDLDGILSALFLMQRGYQIGGVYDLKTFYLKDSLTLDDCFGVDLDLSLPGVPSVGHHYHLLSHLDHYNPNKVFGVCDPQQFQTLNDFMLPPRFAQKCPLPMILILYSLTKTPLPKNPYLRAWLLYADGLYRSFEKYKNNVKSWLRDMHLEELIEDLESKEKHKHIEVIVATIQSFSNSIGKRGFNPTPKKPHPQCSFGPLQMQLLEPFVNHLQRLLYSAPNIDLPDLVSSEEGFCYQFYLNDDVYHQLEGKFNQGLVISHGVLYQNSVSVTLTEPLDEQDDLHLLRSRTSRCVQQMQKVTP